MPPTPPLDKLLADIAAGKPFPVVLVVGDLVLAEPAGQRVAQAMAQRAGCAVDQRRRPTELGPILADLETFSLFSTGKVVVVVDSAVLADRNAAAGLLDEAGEVLPLSQKGGLGGREREAASRLLQAVRVFGVDPLSGDPDKVLSQLPAWAFQGGTAFRKRRQNKQRSKGDVETLRDGLAELLHAARNEGMVGDVQGDLAELGRAIEGGLPPQHSLVLIETSAAAEHPLVQALLERGAVVESGHLASDRGGAWQGLDLLADELEKQTGVSMAQDALQELARRTLRQGEQHADSTARFAGEYRKLAELADGPRIARRLVEDVVEDRGEEDVWQLLDAIAAGRGGEALERVSRLLRSAEDPLAARLSFFSLLAGFCRQLVAVGGLLIERGLPRNEANYNKFKIKLAGDLQAELPGGRKNPVGGLHPFRLHRVYLAASRFPAPELAELPWLVLETELRLKGESGDPDVALADLIARLSGPARPGQRARG